MRGINKAIVVGNLGNDPEVRFTTNDVCVANFSVATNMEWIDKESGKKQKRVEWHKIVLWRRLAEIASEYLHKGSPVYIEGRMQTRKWEDKDGITRWTTEIVGNDLQMLGKVGSSEREPVPENIPEDDIPF